VGVCDGYFHMHFKVCSCIYRTWGNRTQGEYEYGTVLHLIIQLIFFKVCRYIYRIICNNNNNNKMGYLNMGQYFSS